MRELLTIGTFARAARLSPKALRLYDELGLLRPAAVDGESGYRYYDPAQLERARLIAWLRRLGMPLARVRQVCDLPAPDAAEEVAAYWRHVTAETEARGRLAAFLVDHLSGRGSAVKDTTTTPGIRYAARSEPGPVRTSNEDIAYAGERLLAVADGMRGPGGDRAAAAAVDALTRLRTLSVPAEDLLGALADAVGDAERAIRDIAASTPSGEAVTTLTALVWSGSRLALAHIGDSRAYLFRDGGLFQITHDHSYVQSLIDEGRLTPEEAVSHPRRSLLVRALTGTGSSLPDLSMHEAVPGDRYLLCSDGLPGVVPAGVLRETLAGPGGPQQVADELIDLAYAAGAPDNVACVVAEVVAGAPADTAADAAADATADAVAAEGSAATGDGGAAR
ncbi:MerR family transcriptional regulator [Microbispora sitophila]|uniref:MerR family transcriptional regulator n=1 Tax=Microbispora sitophila TaxID=2771537 RepID=UPI00299F54C3|nr:MerR family transcriptional regulator [Microbispora sitophila]